jgi:hypothetical protein
VSAEPCIRKQGAAEKPSLPGRGILFNDTCRLSGLGAHQICHTPRVHRIFFP